MEKTIHASDDDITRRLGEIQALITKLDDDPIAVLLKNYAENSGPAGAFHSLLAGNNVAEFAPSVLVEAFKKVAADTKGKIAEMRTSLQTAANNIKLAQAGLDTADLDASGHAKKS
jgi:hypothetical protein